MHNLLQPGGATFGMWRDDYIRGLGLVGKPAPYTFLKSGSVLLLSFNPFGYRG
jgi:hypothetical protein